jgi:hypothetical protein
VRPAEPRWTADDGRATPAATLMHLPAMRGALLRLILGRVRQRARVLAQVNPDAAHRAAIPAAL